MIVNAVTAFALRAIERAGADFDDGCRGNGDRACRGTGREGREPLAITDELAHYPPAATVKEAIEEGHTG